MLVISAGMQKSGSAYLFNLLNDVFVEAGESDVREIKRKHALDDLLQHHNCNVGKLTTAKVLRLFMLSRHHDSFVVKTHAGPSRLVCSLMRLKLLKAVYVYRDPRDVLLSAMDHGKRILAEGERHTFANMVTFEDAFTAVRSWIRTWERWRDCGNAFLLRYEDLMAEPLQTLKKVMDYLEISAREETLRTLIEKYGKERMKEKDTKDLLHFNKGIVNRYREEMPEEQRKIFQGEIGPILLRMGYPDY